jgi:hypothetical protein
MSSYDDSGIVTAGSTSRNAAAPTANAPRDTMT